MRKNKKRVVFTITVLVIIGLLGTAMIIERGLSNKIRQPGPITIGYSADNLVIERWQRDQAIFLEKAESLGVKVIAHNANENNETQKRQIRELIKQQVDVIVIIPYDKDGLVDVVEEAKKENIKVIAYDRLITNAPIDAYISFDNIKVGELMAQQLLKVAPQGNYVIINGSPEDNNSTMFHKGYMNVLEPFIENGTIKIIKEGWAQMWREEPARDLVLEAIATEEEITAVLGANDRLAEAAIRALSENGLANKVYVVGHDADISACQRIIEGTQYATIYKPIRSLAEAAVELAVSLAQGEPIDVSEKISNGYKEIPFIKLDVIAVTKDNMEETVIFDGFHRYEDVYRNP